MARGGVRAGAGRPPGSKAHQTDLAPPADITAAQYLHRLMNDVTADPSRRDRAASVLLTYENRLTQTGETTARSGRGHKPPKLAPFYTAIRRACCRTG
jgi:hypothetical protein